MNTEKKGGNVFNDMKDDMPPVSAERLDVIKNPPSVSETMERYEPRNLRGSVKRTAFDKSKNRAYKPQRTRSMTYFCGSCDFSVRITRKNYSKIRNHGCPACIKGRMEMLET